MTEWVRWRSGCDGGAGAMAERVRWRLDVIARSKATRQSMEPALRGRSYCVCVTELITTGVTGTSAMPLETAVGTAAMASAVAMPEMTLPNTA